MAAGDAFVVLPPLTEAGAVVFGKNSSRPRNEVQELVYVKGETLSAGVQKCTYLEIQNPATPPLSVILSKPGWSWGADTGANERGVAVGTIWQSDNQSGASEQGVPTTHLIPMDVVRLGLERGECAESAVNAMGGLIELYCPPGAGTELPLASYLIADNKEAWLLNSAGQFWCAEKISSGFKRVPYGLSVTKVDNSSEGLQQKAQDLGLWNGEGEFNFSAVFGKAGDSQWPKGDPKSEGFSITDMFTVLRDKENGICKDRENEIATQSSQVSTLSSDRACCHWFTATPDPSISVYKPFVFTPDARISPLTISNEEADHMHGLYKLHASGAGGVSAQLLRDLESSCVEEMRAYLDSHPQDNGGGESTSGELDDLMKDCVEAEVKFYR